MPDKAQDEQRAADRVVVPNVVGEHFLRAREIAQTAGLTLANPDPDGPPISSIAWPRNPIIQSQSPAPGSVSYRKDSLRIWLRQGLEPDMARKLENPPPSTDRDHATPELQVQTVELSSDSAPEEPTH
jgi:beta-lactam-binding protein with PASTA domain